MAIAIAIAVQYRIEYAIINCAKYAIYVIFDARLQ